MAEEGEDRSQLIAHFQEITGIEDEAKILEHLDSHQWNLEAAVQDALNEKEGIGSVYSSAPPSPSGLGSPPPTAPTSQRMNRQGSQFHQQAVVQRQGWLEWTTNIAFYPLRFVVSAANELFQVIVSVLFGSEPAVSQDPHGDARHFIAEFKSQFGSNHPPFLIQSYDESLSQARKDLKFLLVYVHSAGHQDTPWFCKDVLCSQQFIRFLEDNSILCFGVSVKTQEGVRVSHILRENTYPFLALIVLKQSRLVVCERIEGATPLDDIIGRLRGSMLDNEGELVVERTERMRRLEDQQLREAQDQAFQESLEADRAKQKRKEEDQSRAEELAREQQRIQQEEEKEKADFEVERAVCVSRLAPEPDPNDPEALQVVLRLPSGHRLERRFRLSDNLRSLYDFAYTDESGQLPRSFTLVLNYPRKELVMGSTGGPSLQELNLGKRCALYVQDDAA